MNPRILRNHIEKQHGVEPSEEFKQEVQEHEAEEHKSADVPDDFTETIVEEVNSEFEVETLPPKKKRGGRGKMKEKPRFECGNLTHCIVSKLFLHY